MLSTVFSYILNLPYCERPIFTLIQRNTQNNSTTFFNTFAFRKQNLVRMVGNSPRASSALNFLYKQF